VILAGGRGYRFWPKSTDDTPKQFLTLFGDESLLQATARRLERLAPPGDIYVVTGATHAALVRQQLPALPAENVIVEPGRRDTAAAIGLASAVLARRDPEAVSVVVPSDHLVHGVDAWAKSLGDACAAAEATGRPVLVGVRPTRPETAYGYILLSDGISPPPGVTSPFYRVARFIEKPAPDLARRLLAANRCLWNSGMFVWKVRTALDLIRRHLPHTHDVVTRLARRAERAGNGPVPAALYATIPPISVDYGVLEKTDGVLVTPGEFAWDDLGGWESLARLSESDDKGNVLLGKTSGRVVLHECEDCIIDWSDGPLISAGLKGLVIAGSSGRLLVSARDRLPVLKDLLKSAEGNESK